MSNLNIETFNLPEGTNEVIIRTGKAPEIREPEPYSVSGDIETPANFLALRPDLPRNEGILFVDKKKGVLRLEFFQDRSDKKISVSGSVRMDSLIQDLKINSGAWTEPKALSDFLRMKKRFFIRRNRRRILSEGLKVSPRKSICRSRRSTLEIGIRERSKR